MDLNKKGQGVFIGIMIFVMVFIAVIILVDPLKEQISYARGTTSLDCDNTSITTGNKATCVVVDFVLFYFVGAAIAAGAAYLWMKKVTPYE